MAEMQKTLITKEGLEKMRRSWKTFAPRNVRK